MGPDDDDDTFDEITMAYKAVMKELILRGDTIEMTDGDDVCIVVGRVYDDGLRIDRRSDTLFSDIISVTDNGLIISETDTYKFKRFKRLKTKVKRIPIISTVTDTIFIPWYLVTDIRLRYHHKQDGGVEKQP